MGFQVCMGAAMQCSFGAAPSNLVVLPINRIGCPVPAARLPALVTSAAQLCRFSGMRVAFSPSGERHK